jgi:hypothetical protein
MSFIQLATGTGGEKLHTDEISDEHLQVCKLAYGPDGTGTDVQDSAPLPVASLERSGEIYDGTAVCEVKRAAISVTGSEDNTLVAAVTSKKIRVVSMVFYPTAALGARFESGAGGAALTGIMQLATKEPLVLQHNKHGHFETAAGALLNLELTTSTAGYGFLNYIEAS